jgi:hypothetical protein
MGWKFYAGVGLCLAGIVLMSFPDAKPCVDCDDEVTEVSVLKDPDTGNVAASSDD